MIRPSECSRALYTIPNAGVTSPMLFKLLHSAGHREVDVKESRTTQLAVGR